MTLKEKIYIAINGFSVNKNRVEQCEKIADEFAIDFADWFNVNAYKFPNKSTTKELLEIYKKTL